MKPKLVSIRLSDGRLRYMAFRNALKWARQARKEGMSLWMFLELGGER